MKIAFFSTAAYERDWFTRYQGHHAITFLEETLNAHSCHLAKGYEAVCAFVEDDLSAPVLQALKSQGVKLVAMRCVGLDNVDLEAAEEADLTVLHVPGYSPYSVAEHAVALLMSFVRQIPQAYTRVQQGNFSINGLTGQDLHGKTVGIVGTGRIGQAFSQIMLGFGCRVIAFDPKPNLRLLNSGVRYVSLQTLWAESDVISFHCPLNSHTANLLNADAIAQLKPTAIVVNTGRGKLVDTAALLNALDNQKLGGYATDVYAGEKGWFHRDFSGQPITDDELNRLRLHPRVLLTAHQGFLTEEALQQIAHNLLLQISYFQNSRQPGISKISM
ncbi:2-hydroxyacid dehydrogenase [Larkinella sp. VNQ87]|uniref:2-hydroxyacid dehydrogenase n=1 Tax=Larkinella sp. VNQ87 TaxID=3400921 RepID=UPI003C0734AB